MSQGIVVTYLRCDGIFNDDFTADLLSNLSLIIGEVMGNIIVASFLTHNLYI